MRDARSRSSLRRLPRPGCTRRRTAALQRARAHRRRRGHRRRRSSRRSTPSRTRARRVRQSPLTYFEFGTLAALRLFAQRAARRARSSKSGSAAGSTPSTSSMPTSPSSRAIGIDHVDYLGSTREAIGREKAGIFRAGRPAICGDARSAAIARRARRRRSARRCGASAATTTSSASRPQWRYRGPGGARYGLPFPALRGAYQLGNAATALAALDALRDRLPVAAARSATDSCTSSSPGRFQVLPGRPAIVLDVAHNPHAARVLADTLGAMGVPSARRSRCSACWPTRTSTASCAAMRRRIDRWYVATLPGPRGAAAARIVAALRDAGVDAIGDSRHSTTSNTHSPRRVPRPARLIESRPSARSSPWRRRSLAARERQYEPRVRWRNRRTST